MSYSSITILPGGDLLIKTGPEILIVGVMLNRTDTLPHTSIASFLKSNDYEVIQIFEWKPNVTGGYQSHKPEYKDYFKDGRNHKYYIIYSLNYPDRCWKVWDTDVTKLYNVVGGECDSVTFERMPFHSNYYINRDKDDILFHQKEQSDIRDIKINKIIDN